MSQSGSDPETRALADSDDLMRGNQSREHMIRAQSVNLVIEQYGYYRRGLLLLRAAVRIGIPDRTQDDRERVVLALASLQAELLEDSWAGMLIGRYAASSVPLRLINELGDYIPAAALDKRLAARLLNDEEVRPSDARKVLVGELEDLRSDPVGAERWVTRRKTEADGFNKVAHARTALIVAVSHIRGGTAYVGHDFNPRSLFAVANELAQQSVNASVTIGVALSKQLPDGGAWSLEQSRLHQDWRRYLESKPEPPAIAEL
jgi:hypothetical protein